MRAPTHTAAGPHRRCTATVAAVAVLAVLTACSSQPEPVADATGRRSAATAEHRTTPTPTNPTATTATATPTTPAPTLTAATPTPSVAAPTSTATSTAPPDPDPATIIEGERRPATSLPKTIHKHTGDATPIHCHWNLERLQSHQCFTINTPLTHQPPHRSDTTKLTAAAQREGNPNQPALIVLAPTEGTTATAIAAAKTSEPYRQIYIDHRGTGWLHDYACDAVYDTIAAAAALTRPAAHQTHIQTLQHCASTATDPAAVAAAQLSGLAADVAAAAEALNIRQWVVYGAGHGAEIALTLLADPPPGLRGAIIDGLRPATGDLYRTKAASAALNELAQHCAADTDCTQILAPHGTDLTAIVDTVIKRLDSNPRLVVNPTGSTLPDDPLEVLLDGDTFAAAVAALLDTTDRAAALPAIVAGVASGDELYEATAALLATEAAAAQARSTAAVTHWLMVCSQHRPGTDPAAGTRFAQALTGPGFVEVCGPWQRHLEAGLMAEPRPQAAGEGLPVLMLVGRLDPGVDPEDSLRFAASRGRVVVAEFGHLGHPVWGSGDGCAARIVEAFMASPGVGVDAGCAGGGQRLSGWRTF